MISSVTPKPPIRQWRIENFKSIVSATIDFAPLTLLVGANSSGKSSLLQSILLMVQAAQSRQIGDVLPLNGPLVSVGTFDEVRCAWGRTRSIKIGATVSREFHVQGPVSAFVRSRSRIRSPAAFEVEGSVDALRWDIQLSGKAKAQRSAANIASVQLKAEGRQALALSAKARPASQQDLEAWQLGRVFGRRLLHQLARGADFSLDYVGHVRLADVGNAEIRGILMRAGIPVSCLVWDSWNTLLVRQWITSATRRSSSPSATLRPDSPSLRRDNEYSSETPPSYSMDTLVESALRDIHIWKEDVEAFRARATSISRDLALRFRHGPFVGSEIELLESRILERLQGQDKQVLVATEADEILDFASEFLSFLRDQVLYLGPLRQEPQVVYKNLPALPNGNLGPRGELTAPVLENFGEQLVLCPMDENSSNRLPLSEAVEYWLGRLDIAEGIGTRDRGALGVGLEVRRPGITRPLDLTNVGVGVSQILPVVVMCLMAPPGSVLLLEQPELHLHPAVQQRLGDFFLALARSGRQLIVETHSEYMINRLRRRIAQDASDEVLKLISVIFAEIGSSGTEFRPIRANRFGTIEDWPEGFFDQSPKESADILRAAAHKQRESHSER